ncbi:protein TolR [Nevskia sp.]|uniref:protein TolR n=1 Tax=Nevskia sp. TaxID=1929292 RepID=UPI0025F9325A|nr:protein TolR [Nevskia sp.]
MAGGGFAPKKSKRRLTAEMNVVPYIDVMLVLLVIFMVTAPLLTQGIDVELPQASAETLSADDEPLTLFVDAKGDYFLDAGGDAKKPLADQIVIDRVSAILRNKPETLVLIRADKAVKYDRVANGMSLLQAAGAAKIGFVTDAPTTPRPANTGKRERG